MLCSSCVPFLILHIAHSTSSAIVRQSAWVERHGGRERRYLDQEWGHRHPSHCVSVLFLEFLYRLASSVLPSSVIGPLAALVESESESEKLLRTMPSEQAALQQDVSQVERDQAVLGRDMDNLSARIRQLEERRIRRSRRARLLRRKIIDDDLG